MLELCCPHPLMAWLRNAALGHGDSKDRAYPDQVHLEKTVKAGDPNKFVPIRVRAVSMAKLHTSTRSSILFTTHC